jgi:hypothetical protein
VNCNTVAIALEASFVSEDVTYTDAQLNNIMIDSWLDIEDQPEMIIALIDDETKELKSAVAITDDTLNVINNDDDPEIVKVILSDEDKLSCTEMQTTIQKLVVNAESKGFGEATILLHRFSAELRKAQQKKATGDGRITNFFQKVKDP